MTRGRKPGPGPHSDRHERTLKEVERRNDAIRGAPDNYFDLPKKIKFLRLLRGDMSQEGLAERINARIASGKAPRGAKAITQTRVSKWEKRQGNPSLIQVALMADVLQVPRAYLLDPYRTEPPDLEAFQKELAIAEMAEGPGGYAALYWKIVGIPMVNGASDQAGPVRGDQDHGKEGRRRPG